MNRRLEGDVASRVANVLKLAQQMPTTRHSAVKINIANTPLF